MAALQSVSSLHSTISTKASFGAFSRIQGRPQSILFVNGNLGARQSFSLLCRAEKRGAPADKVEAARKLQTTATDLLAQLMKAENTEQFARENAEHLTQEFFMVASTYLSMAKKEGNANVVNRIESTLKIAMREREKTLRPEIQLLNQLLRDKGTSERKNTMEKFADYLNSDSYFFQLLNRMTLDVEKQPTSRTDPSQIMLLSQLRGINKEAREYSRALKHAAKE